MLFYPVNTKQIKENIYAINAIFNNFYIIDTGSSLIAFDTGINKLLTNNKMQKIGLNPNNVSNIFLTHSDYDHVGGLNAFKNANIYLSKKEEPMVTGKKARLLIKYNRRLYNYKLLDDREIITIDNVKIQTIFSPGHTIGSCCYLVNDEILITGDTLRVSKNGAITPFLFFQNMNHLDNKTSVDMLKNENILEKANLILTGHTGILKK